MMLDVTDLFPPGNYPIGIPVLLFTAQLQSKAQRHPRLNIWG